MLYSLGNRTVQYSPFDRSSFLSSYPVRQQRLDLAPAQGLFVGQPDDGVPADGHAGVALALAAQDRLHLAQLLVLRHRGGRAGAGGLLLADCGATAAHRRAGRVVLVRVVLVLVLAVVVAWRAHIPCGGNRVRSASLHRHQKCPELTGLTTQKAACFLLLIE